MPLPIEDYALIGDTESAALVGVDGSIDWLCLPRFDSGATFAALLGDPDNGRWLLAPAGSSRPAGRRYRGDTLVLETTLANDEGTVRVIDFMPRREPQPSVVRIVEGVHGRVTMRSELRPRFDYGHVVPWWQPDGRLLRAWAGPDGLAIDGDVRHTVEDDTAAATFTVDAGDRVALALRWTGIDDHRLPRVEATAQLRSTEAFWRRWAARCRYDGPYRDAVVRSLLTLKALSYSPSGGIVAAATTSLPESLGGVRNWDYRYCWIRDATYTLLALLDAGYEAEAKAWREWLLRALAGRPEQMQILYGVTGERRLPETELDWLSGYADSRPVRIGNAAAGQFQLDVYGELMDALHQARAAGIPPDESAWQVQLRLMDFLEGNWQEPDNGIWEMRGPRRQFVHSKVMAAVAVDRAVRGIEDFGLDGPLERWVALREEIRAEVCAQGYDSRRGTFTQSYGSRELDATALLMAPMGFLPAEDPRVGSTVDAVQRELGQDGFIQRYSMTPRSRRVDALPPGEGAFLACTFWLADALILQGRRDEGQEVFERLLDLRNDVGLLSEEYDVTAGRLVGNLPQAFSHVPLVNTALSLTSNTGPTQRRGQTARQRT